MDLDLPDQVPDSSEMLVQLVELLVLRSIPNDKDEKYIWYERNNNVVSIYHMRTSVISD